MRTDEHNPDVVIIGGGLAGLASAIFLARQEKSIVLLERSHSLGGRAQTKEQDGFQLNLGPHALYRAGRGIEVLKELGIRPRGGLPQASGGFVVNGNVKHTLPAGPLSLLTTGLFGLAAKLETARLLGSLRKIDGNSVMDITVREWVDNNISHPDVRNLALALFRLATYTNAPEQMSAGAAIKQLQIAVSKNVLYLDGGWQTLVDSLQEIATRSGAIIRTGAKAGMVERNSAGQVMGVHLANGEVYKTQNVIIASSPAIAVELVEGGRRTSLQSWAEDAIPVKAACLDVALTHLPKPGATFALGIDRPLYLSVHSAVARLAPTGGALIHLAKYLPPNDNEPADRVERELETLLEMIQPGWRQALVYRRFLPEMIVYNAMTTARRGGTKGRPGPEVQDVPGLLVAGDWVGKEGLLADASLASAKEASRLLSVARSPLSQIAVVN